MQSEIPANSPLVPEPMQLTPNMGIPDDRHPLIAFCENNEVFMNETNVHFEKLMLDFSQLELDTKQRTTHLNYR
ncbi:hypothetical protein GCK72_002992 [Caenorhabditis remanei]|uniref:Uncharacterized protein n=1 Tax=Caenorhabditis remanei TaxID=31234 RepID=A0A6A5HWC2_CAERE|nr:hypothetical protein GCK72_002992 [Caenorhabditis remanei]KAF1771166.1 hypothetical protein GCK72_002992 [Caenorhabditis remanei]